MRRLTLAVIALAALQCVLDAQVPQPFPRPRDQQAPPRPAPTAPPPVQTTPAPAPAAAPAATPVEDIPTEASLGVPLYPNSQFITSYDAGKGQRFYLFGSAASFAELVKYYQTVLKNKGTLVFEAPAVHVFEGRFREDTMAFPPGVTIKDYTWNGSPGYLNPRRDGKPERYPSIIQIVPAPAGAAQR